MILALERWSLTCPLTVEDGAKKLDEIYPDWHNKIELGRLEMESKEKCILGQLYGHAALKSPFKPPMDWCESAFGYTPEHRQKWIAEIMERRAIVPE